MDNMLECSSCLVQFEVIWMNNAFTSGIEFCPFCGVELEDYEYEKQD